LAKFGYYLIYGNPIGTMAETSKNIKKWAEVAKQKNCELVFWGASYGTSENIVLAVKGAVTDFEELYSVDSLPPISDRRTTFVGISVVDL